MMTPKIERSEATLPSRSIILPVLKERGNYRGLIDQGEDNWQPTRHHKYGQNRKGSKMQIS